MITSILEIIIDPQTNFTDSSGVLFVENWDLNDLGLFVFTPDHHPFYLESVIKTDYPEK